MKRIILFASIIFQVFQAAAQESFSSFALTVVAPDQIEKVSPAQISVLKSKMAEIVTQNGIASATYDQPYVIYPVFSVNNLQSSAGGMRAVVVADCYFSMFIKEVNSKTIFASYSQSIKGSGMNNDLAINNAIQQVNPRNPDIQAFVKEAKTKIVAYYNQNCGKVLAQAEQATATKNFDYALALLTAVPTEASSCFSQANVKVSSIFEKAQEQQCQNLIIQAKSEAAANNFRAAFNTISQVDATSKCKEEAKKLIDEWSTQVDDEVRKSREFFLQVYNGQIEVQKARYHYLAEATRRYWVSRPILITYQELIR